MSKLADIKKGFRARKTVPFPGILQAEEGQPEIVVDLVALSGGEHADALENARAFAKSKGVDAPKPGEPEYDLGLMVHTLLRACKDHSSPEAAPAPFFVSAAELLDALDTDSIVHLSTLQGIWQREVSPAPDAELTEETIWGHVVEAAEMEDPLRFFEKRPPAIVARLLHFTARRLVSVLQAKSLSSFTSDTSGASASKAEAVH